jgi:DNA-binding response OmpR family regulator
LALLVDDDDDSRLIYGTILSRGELEVITACDGAAALCVARATTPNVIVLDIGLPMLDGVEVLKSIRRDPNLCEIPVIALTGRAMLHEQSAVQALGFNQVLLKPCEPVAVLAAVEAQLRGRRVSGGGFLHPTDCRVESDLAPGEVGSAILDLAAPEW